ncbi:hypothetical protein [uncultured Roseobacter sp.]|uniref:hypothetical protein n=1 Tax=uncultured Roseobacter sp. TaxID=114847 RepID=UPI00260B55C5|nr:hypothetical protein [uncultured Roseobacter sp.]
MPRWIWFAPLTCLVLALAGWGFRMGWIAATITETDVIGTFAAEYLRLAGPEARATDCSARPGIRGGVWITVICASPQGQTYRWAADRFGRLIPDVPDAVGVREPRT